MNYDICTPLNKWSCIECNSIREKPAKWSTGYNPIGTSRTMLCRECETENWHNATMNEKLFEFVKAVQNNEYAEYKLDKDKVLITDMDSRPYVVLPYGVSETSVQKVDDLLFDKLPNNIVFGEVELVEQENSFDYAHITEFKVKE